MPWKNILNWCSNIFVLNNIKKTVASVAFGLYVFFAGLVLKIFNLQRQQLSRIMDENVEDSELEVRSDSDDSFMEEQAMVTEAGDARPDVSDTDEDEQQFDITLPETHSYMGPSLEPLSGRRVLEPGWAGRVPGMAHHGAVFPGETVPLLPPPGPLRAAILADRLFCLLAPDESGTKLSGLGVLCEVQSGAEDAGVIARAAHRVRLKQIKLPAYVHDYSSMQMLEVVVLGERAPSEPLRPTLLRLRHAHYEPELERRVRRLEAAASAWPAWVWRLLDYHTLRARLAVHCRPLRLGGVCVWVWRLLDYHTLRARLAVHCRPLRLEDKMPEEPVSLSFWVASNLALTARDRLALLAADDALLRLRLALRAVDRSTTLCCVSCGAEVARRDRLFAMSSAGLHANFTNLGGFMHDVVTSRDAANVTLSAPSTEYSWFPGYSWRIAVCASCHAHVGWRFEGLKRSLRPAQFYALTRNTVAPLADGAPEPL